jgi:sialidase-1
MLTHLATTILMTLGQSGATQAPVFVAGEGGYHTYRIPALLVTPRGTVFAFCEGRKTGSSDTGDIDLVLKRSSDHGSTWQPLQVVWDDEANTCGNPCPVVDRDTGTIWLLLTHNLGRDKQAQIVDGSAKGKRTVWVSKSSDDGATWTKPVEITSAVSRPDWTWYATGPGIGIQTRSGRLVIPCDHYVAGSKARGAHVIYSDDHGATWQRGGAVAPDCNECQVVELSDGRLMLNIRSYKLPKCRLVALSKDGGLTWSEPAPDEALVDPVCQASILRLPGAKNGIAFSNAASTKREKMTVRLSYDDGRTWPVAKELHAGPAGYSCLAALGDGRVACLYEAGQSRYYETIVLARFKLD